MSMIESYPVLGKWTSKAGPRPTKSLLDEASSVARPGTKEAVAIAMALRDDGATQQEVKMILGTPHRNKIRLLVARGKAKRVIKPSRDGHTVYKIHLK